MHRSLIYSQSWSAEQHKRYQAQMLERMVRHAYAYVPFYQRLLREQGLKLPDRITLGTLEQLPTISKQDLRQYRDEFKASNFPSHKFQYHTTGGSTAAPVGLYWEADRTVPIERAFMKRQFGWVNYNPETDRTVALRGIPPSNNRSFEYVTGSFLRLSSYRMTPEVLDQYIDLIISFQPAAIQAYPSAAVLLARHVIDRGGVHVPSLRVVLCGSEKLTDSHRRIISRAFNCRVYSWYGQSEYVALSGECEHSTEYHFYSEYGIVEILKSNGYAAGPGETGEVVATGFLNFAFPLIRYRTEDLATVSTREFCQCGRSYRRVSAIEGRIQEMIVSRHGNFISMTALNMHDDVFDNVYQFQFYQERAGHIELRLVPKPTYTVEGDGMRIMKALKAKLNDQFSIEIVIVDKVEQTLRGKTSFLVQKIPIRSEWD